MGECQEYRVDYDRMTTDFLFARPSYLSGIARLIDLLCVFQLYNVSKNPVGADCRAAFSDWVMVGRDMKNAAETWETIIDSSAQVRENVGV